MAPVPDGVLQVCATPIGNLGDVTPRVIDALTHATVVLAEDTRVTRKLFTRYGIETPLERYDEHTAAKKSPEIVRRIEAGARIALVSDAGTPGISDPGALLVDAALEAGVAVEVLPGPSAIVTALVASGLPTHAFYFGGFLSRKAGERDRLLGSLESLDATLVFYESPRRVATSLAALAVALPGRRAAIARELTKLHEEVVRGPIAYLADEFGSRDSVKGEVVVLVGPPPRQQSTTMPANTEQIRQRMEELLASGAKRAQAAKQVATEFNVSRNDVYDLDLREGREASGG